MNEKSEALRLADALRDGLYLLSSERDATEAVLRRLHADNERLHQINWSHEMKLSVRGYEMQIDSLKADNERLRETLQWIASRCPTDQFVDLQPHRIHLEAAHDAGACARAALKEVQR